MIYKISLLLMSLLLACNVNVLSMKRPAGPEKNVDNDSYQQFLNEWYKQGSADQQYTNFNDNQTDPSDINNEDSTWIEVEDLNNQQPYEYNYSNFTTSTQTTVPVTQNVTTNNNMQPQFLGEFQQSTEMLPTDDFISLYSQFLQQEPNSENVALNNSQENQFGTTIKQYTQTTQSAQRKKKLKLTTTTLKKQQELQQNQNAIQQSQSIINVEASANSLTTQEQLSPEIAAILKKKIRFVCVRSNQNSNQQEQIFSCDVKGCNARFTKSYNLLRHKRDLHNNDNNYQHRCDQCSETFRKKRELSTHKNHEHNWVCHACNLKFTLKERFENHMKTHQSAEEKEKTKTFECDICYTRFERNADLKKHKDSVHTNEHPYKCSCGSAYKRRKDLNVHIRKNPEHTPLT